MDEPISFEVAKLACEVGFYKTSKDHGEVCGGWYNELGLYLGRIDIDEEGVDLKIKYPTLNYERRKKYYLESYYAPTQSILQRWLREEKDIHVTVSCRFDTVKPYYEWRVQTEWYKTSQFDDRCHTYEEALNKGLLEGLKLLQP